MPVVRTDGRSGSRCTVTWLPNFLGWIDFLSYGASNWARDQIKYQRKTLKTTWPQWIEKWPRDTVRWWWSAYTLVWRYVVTKFSRMDSLPNFVTMVLRCVRVARARAPLKSNILRSISSYRTLNRWSKISRWGLFFSSLISYWSFGETMRLMFDTLNNFWMSLSIIWRIMAIHDGVIRLGAKGLFSSANIRQIADVALRVVFLLFLLYF